MSLFVFAMESLLLPLLLLPLVLMVLLVLCLKVGWQDSVFVLMIRVLKAAFSKFLLSFVHVLKCGKGPSAWLILELLDIRW